MPQNIPKKFSIIEGTININGKEEGILLAIEGEGEKNFTHEEISEKKNKFTGNNPSLMSPNNKKKYLLKIEEQKEANKKRTSELKEITKNLAPKVNPLAIRSKVNVLTKPNSTKQNPIGQNSKNPNPIGQNPIGKNLTGSNVNSLSTTKNKERINMN